MNCKWDNNLSTAMFCTPPIIIIKIIKIKIKNAYLVFLVCKGR
jgi:hypothetical protein